MAGAEDGSTRAVGPYLLQRTLGKGQTGKLQHCMCTCVHVSGGVWEGLVHGGLGVTGDLYRPHL